MDSLFGPTPQEVEQQRMAVQGQQNMQAVTMDPLQSARYGIRQGVGMLTGQAAEAMGGVDPKVEAAKNMQKLQQMGIDTSTPEGLRKLAPILAKAGYPDRARQAMAEAAKMEEGAVDIDHKRAQSELYRAQAGYYGAGGAKGNSSAQLAAKQAIARQEALKIGFNGGLSGQELMDFAEESVRRVTETWNKTIGNDASAEDQPTAPITIGSKASVAGSVEAAKRGEQWVEAVNASGQPAFRKQKDAEALTPAQYSPEIKAGMETAASTGKGAGEENLKQYTAVKKIETDLPKINALIDHLNNSKAITGLGAEVFKGINRAIALLGGKEGAKKASDTEILDVMMGAEVFPLISALGIGARGMDTPAEREFLRKVLTGEVTLNKATLLEMAKMRKDAAERAIVNWNTRNDKGELDNFYKYSGVTQERIPIPFKANNKLEVKALYDAKIITKSQAEQILDDMEKSGIK